MGVVDAQSSEELVLNFPPLIDLRLFSQPELNSLSRTSSSTLNFNDNDDVLIPKIDRSLFNESAGSRRQTYYRLRFATRKPQVSTAEISSNVPVFHQFPDEERRETISLLKQLFADESPIDEKNEEYSSSEDEGLAPIHIGFGCHEAVVDSTNAFIQNIPTDNAPDVGEQRKRKRGRPRKNQNPSNTVIPHVVVPEKGEHEKRKPGRPRKNEIQVIRYPAVVYDTASRDCVEEARDLEKEKVIFNKNENVVDLTALGNTEDQVGEELEEQRKRKRGRPCKNEIRGIPYAHVVYETVNRECVEEGRDIEKESVIVNKTGNDKGLVLLGNTEYRFGEKLGLGEHGKRKQGWPRKNENRGIHAPIGYETLGKRVEDVRDMEKEMAVVHENGNVVDLAMLGRVENPFGEELRKRTEGMETEAELLGYLGRLDGDWGS